ncbi:MAG: TRAP transporter substrate-binding protein DctP [Vicinamibacterales bacterium]|nr:TRAP transporter substrate-binding protein DctP [Vicinamibacterales bacterium]
MRYRYSLITLALILAVTTVVPARAQAPITIKMATLVPENSGWFLVLKDVADKWNKASGGKVRVILYPGGRQGDDPDVVRKMNLGTLNAGVLTSVGVAEIDKSVYALSIPMAFDDYDELYGVLDKMRPSLEAKMAAKGYVVLNWADGGWVHFFSKSPVRTPDDAKKLKMFSWAGDPKTTEIWKSAGFDPRPAPSTELVTGLQTGLFELLGAPPQVAVITRYYETTKFMTDLKWGILLGATVIKKDVWERIPADLRPQLLQIAQDAGKKLQADIRASGERDVEAMKKAGLTVVPVDAKARLLWKQAAEATYPRVRGEVVPPEAFDEAIRLRDEYRKQHPARAAAPAKK